MIINNQDVDHAMFAKTVLEYSFKAMSLDGCKASTDRFPRLLQIIEKYPQLKGLFETLSKNIPCWMFLRWISQMTALLNSTVSDSVFIVLSRIAKDYPSALIYSITLTDEIIEFGDDYEARKSRVKELVFNSRSELTTRIILEFKRLTDPVHVFLDWYRKVLSIKKSSNDSNCLIRNFNDMKDLILCDSEAGTETSKFFKLYARIIYDLCGRDGKRLTSMSLKYIESEFKNLIDRASTQKANKGIYPLKKYSPFLANFSASNFKEVCASEIVEILRSWTISRLLYS